MLDVQKWTGIILEEVSDQRLKYVKVDKLKELSKLETWKTCLILLC